MYPHYIPLYPIILLILVGEFAHNPLDLMAPVCLVSIPSIHSDQPGCRYSEHEHGPYWGGLGRVRWQHQRPMGGQWHNFSDFSV